ncbi:hypothetical protein CLPU_11c00430 [Gottschalkia purinilytica]|uniref:Uncharacterized protein n=1 Tax=Gottschalkia purinilytica TaxID=1503 RepID=A0A0L0W8K2_GOTPU|nr:hypothetical protein [Gottschalkia purinilytica]KNF07874.1 hypothetical protein CLPU_11c00430 [Gottschalkia purinilytica]
MSKAPLGKEYGPAYAVSSFGLIYDEDKAFEKLKELSNNVIKFDKEPAETINMYASGEVDILGTYSFIKETMKDNVPTKNG